MKEQFLIFLNKLMEHDQKFTDSIINSDVNAYIKVLSEAGSTKTQEITENGKLILGYLQSISVEPRKAKDIAEGLFIAPRKVSGGMRKLVTDGFVEKIGDSPISYVITEKGKNYTI